MWVFWNDAAIASYMSRTLLKSPLEYTVEINPPTEAPLKSYLYHDIRDFATFSSETKSLISSGKKSSINSTLADEEYGLTMSSMFKYSTRFDGLKEGESYTVSISTELDGKTIAQVTMSLNSSPKSSEAGKKKDS